MSTEQTTTIHGYEITLDAHPDNETTQCYIIFGRYSATLECLMGMGCLTGDEGDLAVPQRTIDAIEKWAEEHGY